MSLSKEDIERLGMLSRIKIENPEILAYELSGIFSWIDQLKNAQVDDVVLHEHNITPQMHERKDHASLNAIPALENAPKTEHGFFVVPKMID